MSKSQATDPVPLSEALVELSNERDGWLRRLIGAWADGWRACEAAHGDDYERGYLQAVADIKATDQALADRLGDERRQWGPGGRAHFTDPRPGDYPGGALPLERPGQIWLAGPVVHYHECTAVCRSYKAGWYKVPDPQGGVA